MNYRDEQKNQIGERSEGLVNLSDVEERLLLSFVDGECKTFWSHWRAQRLMKSRPGAQRYVDSMRGLSSSLKESGVLEGEMSQDLWGRIERRVIEEEKTAFYLGKRRTPLTKDHSFVEALRGKLGWGLSGALVSACVGFLVISLSTNGNFGSGALPAQNNASQNAHSKGALAPVSLVDARGSEVSNDRINPSAELQQNTPIRIARNPIPRAMEVDWMRSHGRVNVIQDPDENSAILWVKRKPLRQVDAEAYRQRSLQQGSPLDQFLRNEEPEVSSSRQPIRMIDRDGPTALSVINR